MSEIIEVLSHRWSIDMYHPKTHKIELDKIWGFEIHWRGKNSWHVVVCPKEGYKYDLSHWVGVGEIAKLITNPKVTIKNFVNYHNTDYFMTDMKKLFTVVSKE